MGADLIVVALKRASLFSASREGAVLRDTNLVKSELRQTNLQDTQLIGSDYSGCRLKGACFTDAEGLTCQQKQWL
ncbi:pentapeptide repeat-containing protein [Microcoleus sp. OTE_8_concoct_300]|uniref:pentapeptide repeat-containing protein n=1 Tax=Microcoleus sp. OTE_8_concoct_300 TaxID=2964710 RepID=UPI00403F6988